MINSSDTLIYLSVLFNGDWNKIYDAISNMRFKYSVEEVEKAKTSIKSKVITILDPDYPAFLKNIRKPPFVLYYYGDLSLALDIEKILGVVGARDATSYGLEMTKTLVNSVSKNFVIISGLARGVDSAAHLAAITSKGKTIAVLPSGIDYCYPPSNIGLYNEIKKNHLLISEFPGNYVPNEADFPFRNRIIAGLCKGLLVPDAGMRSGSSITASAALELGKGVFAVPHPVQPPSLCNYLIKTGAGLVESGQDIIEEMQMYKIK